VIGGGVCFIWDTASCTLLCRISPSNLSVWCMVYGVWCMVYGVWCMVYGVWCMVHYAYDEVCMV